MRGMDVSDKRRRALAGAGAVAVAGLVACGAPSGTGAARAPATSASTTTASAAPGTPSASTSGACTAKGTPLTLRGPDTGRTVCVATGQEVQVRLTADAGRAWTVDVDGPALVAAPGGGEALPRGVQGASFRADRPGTARIVATRAACPS